MLGASRNGLYVLGAGFAIAIAYASPVILLIWCPPSYPRASLIPVIAIIAASALAVRRRRGVHAGPDPHGPNEGRSRCNGGRGCVEPAAQPLAGANARDHWFGRNLVLLLRDLGEHAPPTGRCEWAYHERPGVGHRCCWVRRVRELGGRAGRGAVLGVRMWWRSSPAGLRRQ